MISHSDDLNGKVYLHSKLAQRAADASWGWLTLAVIVFFFSKNVAILPAVVWASCVYSSCAHTTKQMKYEQMLKETEGHE